MSKDKTFKASHFENIQELLDTCKMWIRDDDYDAYCRFFDMGAMEELLNELEKKDKIIDAMTKFIDAELSSEHLTRVLKKEVLPLKTYREEIKQYFEEEVKDE